NSAKWTICQTMRQLTGTVFPVTLPACLSPGSPGTTSELLGDRFTPDRAFHPKRDPSASPTGHWSMRNLAIASLWLAVPSLLLAQEPTQFEPLASKAALQQFQDNGGQWIVKWQAATGTPGTIYGTGLKIADWREN